MADSVVTFLLDNLSRLLVEHVKLLSGVEDKIRSLINELRFIDIFLKSSEGKRNNDAVKEVVSQIKEVAHRAEDVVDTYVANVTIHRSRNKLKKLFHGKEHLKMLHNVNAEIEKIKGTIDEIYKNKERYGIGEGEFKSGDTEFAESLRERRRNVEEEDVVGLVHDSNFVINQLEKTDSRRNVVSIIGMGGLGKTTLARKIYNDNKVKELFPCRAWGYVSNDYRAKELLLSLLQCLLSPSEYKDLLKKKEDEAEDALSAEKLKKKVRDCLNGKKYLVVLDDIWKTEVWEEIQDAFPDDHHGGSRILITSRIKEVASYTGTAPPYYLPFLNEELSWELFSKKVFRGEECPSDLEPLGRSIVRSCGGLPLAIIVLAGLLAKKEKSQREWRTIMGHINWHLTKDKTEVRDILKLSYDSLPRRLKPCFLYFGIYPEDYEIPVRQLIRLWIAEGFIQPLQETGIPNPPELEDVADYCLNELVDRSLVQVASRRSDGLVKTCRIHDLLRDLCISESKADKFLEVCTESSNISALSNPRRLSLHCKIQLCRSPIQRDYSSTRSFLYFGEHEIDSDDSEWIVKNLKLARILDIGNNFHSYSPSIPHNLGSLIHLRYLHLTAPHFIPDSICSLWNLETLDIWGPGIFDTSLPRKMWELKRLRHLLLNQATVGLPADPSGRNSKTMWNLQTLSCVRLDLGTARLLDNGIFPKLRKLGFHRQGLDERDSRREQLQNLCHLRDLHTLKIYYSSDLPFVANRLPSNLTKITLWNGKFDSECMNSLGQLTKLQTLKLKELNFNTSTTLNCADGEFLQLRVFQMEGMSFERWILAKGAMPRLQHLVIIRCSYSTDLPEELWSLSTLTEVKVSEPSQEMANSLRNVEEKNGRKLIIEFDKMDN